MARRLCLRALHRAHTVVCAPKHAASGAWLHTYRPQRCSSSGAPDVGHGLRVLTAPVAAHSCSRAGVLVARATCAPPSSIARLSVHAAAPGPSHVSGASRSMCSDASAGGGLFPVPEDATVADCVKVLEEHGPGKLAQEMQRHAKLGIFQSEALKALMEYTRNDAAQHREIARSGMPEAIAKAMSSHMFNGPVQRSAAVCLFNLTFHEREAIVDAGGVQALVPILVHHTEDLDSQTIACRALCRLSGPLTVRAMVEAGVVEGLVKTMQTNDFDGAVQESACALVAMISQDAGAVRPLVDGGITPAIVNAIAGPYDSADEHELVLLVGLVALIRLAWASGVTAKYLCEERGLNVLSDVMAALQDRPDVADRASHLAWILCSQQSGPHAIVATDLHKRLIDAVSKHSDVASLTARACGVLEQLSNTPALARELGRAGAGAVCTAARASAEAGELPPHDADIIKATTHVLARLD